MTYHFDLSVMTMLRTDPLTDQQSRNDGSDVTLAAAADAKF